MVAAIEHQHLGPSRDGPRESDGETVGIGCRHRDLPALQPEVALEGGLDMDGTFGRHHHRKPARGSLSQGICEPNGVVSKERCRVAETEIEVVVTVHIGDVTTLGILREQGKGRRPFGHPVHRHPVEQRCPGPLKHGFESRMGLDKASPLPGENLLKNGLVLDLHAVASLSVP